MQIDTTWRSLFQWKILIFWYFSSFSSLLLHAITKEIFSFLYVYYLHYFYGSFSHCVTSNPFNLDRINLVYGDTNCFWRPSNWQFMAVLEWTEMQQTAAIAISATMIFFCSAHFLQVALLHVSSVYWWFFIEYILTRPIWNKNVYKYSFYY